MYCNSCGAKLADDATFCVECGEKTTFSEVSDISIGVDLKEKFKSKPALFGMIASALAMLVGLLLLSGVFIPDKAKNYGTVSISSYDVNEAGLLRTIESSHSAYGGDAYTGMQNAASDAANNARVAAENSKITNKLLLDIAEINQATNAIGESICKTISVSIGLLIFFIGAICFAYFFGKFSKE